MLICLSTIFVFFHLFHVANSLPAPESISLTPSLSPLLSPPTPLISLISHIDNTVTTATSLSLNTTTTSTLTTCNHRNDGWKGDAAKYFVQRGWDPPDTSCVSDVYGVSPNDGVPELGDGITGDSVYDMVVGRAEAVKKVADSFAKALGLDWEDATRATSFGYNIRTQKCVHDYATFVKLQGVWYLSAELTNADKDLTLGKGERFIAWEYTDGKGKTARMEIEGVESVVAVGSGGGSVYGSGFGTIYSGDNLAVSAALRMGEHSTQQASDATTPSNVAILALPLAMNLIPVALVADVNTWGMLIYTILTDILTAVPLGIKGVEVLSVGLGAETGVVTRISGGNLVDDDAAKAGEIWVARCRASADLRPMGIALLVVAGTFLVGGVVAEFVAREWMRKRKKSENVMGDVQAMGLVLAGGAARENKVE